MLDQSLWGDFELVEIKQGSSNNHEIKISKDKGSLTIPKTYAEQLSWIDNERVNLYRFGETFALRPHKVGLLRVKINDGGGLRINSKNLCLELLSRTHSCMLFEAWVEEDALFFKPKKGTEI